MSVRIWRIWGAVPEQETVKAIKKRTGWVIKLAVAAIIVIVLGAGFLAWKNREEPYDAKAQYVWRQENYPKMEELFENEQYAELYTFIEQETALLSDYWILTGISYSVLLSKEDRERLEPFRVQALAGLEGRWDFSQEELRKFEEEVKNNYGYPKYETCEAYIKKWMKEK